MTRTPLVRAVTSLAAVVLFALSTGCYHSVITTNLTPGTEVHHEAFKPAFINGLVPATVDGSSYCPNKRWARVETQHSFLNLLVGAVTLGIFTPMDIKVTCAQ